MSFYGCSYFRYPTNKNLHGAFVEIYHQVTDHNDAQIAFTRDMTHWYRPERRAIIPCGLSGSRDSGGARPWGGLFELPDGYWATDVSWTHIAPQLPGERTGYRTRTVCADASPAGCHTVSAASRRKWKGGLPFQASSVAITSCASTTGAKTAGIIACELIRGVPSRIHPDADPIPGYSFAESDLLTGDELSRPVTWRGKSDISGIGGSLAIRLRMFQAKVFAYSV